MVASPRSSASDSLSAQLAAATLTWSAPPPARDDTELAEEARDAEDDEGELTPALVRIVVVAGLGGLLFGYDTGVCSGALLQIGTSLGGLPLTASQETGIVVSALWGALAGSLLAGRLADWAGRKPVMLGAAVLFALGALEQAAAQVYKEVILGRVLVGIGVGLASMVLPIYLAEISPPAYRGRIVGSLVVLITGGQVLAYVVTAALFHVKEGWRWSFGLGAVPALLQLVLSFSVPESPRYELRQGRIPGARKTLRLLHPRATPDAIQRRIDRILAEVSSLPDDRATGTAKGTWFARLRERLRSWNGSELRNGRLGARWRDRATRRALAVAVGLQWFQQATGFNTLMYFSGKILQTTGISQPAAFAIFVAVSNFLSTLVALRLIDRVGRRTLLLHTLLGQVGGMSLLALASACIPSAPPLVAEGEVAALAVETAGASPWAFVALAAMVVFCASYALGIGNVAWVVQAEVFSQDLRAIGNGLATAANWGGNLLVSSSFLYFTKVFTPAGAFALYAFVSVAAWVFTYLYLPETKGLSLEEVRALFEQQVGLDPTSSATRATRRPGSLSLDHGGYHVVEEESEADEAQGLLAADMEVGRLPGTAGEAGEAEVRWRPDASAAL